MHRHRHRLVLGTRESHQDSLILIMVRTRKMKVVKG